jgi:hypothetical protein
MQALTLPAAQGWRWLTDGFRIFRKNHLMLTFLVISYWMLMALVNVIPMIGTIATTLCIPAFSVSLMNACRSIERGTAAGAATAVLGLSAQPALAAHPRRHLPGGDGPHSRPFRRWPTTAP